MPLNKRRQMGVSLNCSQKVSQEAIVSFFSVNTPAELLSPQPLVFNLHLLSCSLNACLTLPNPQSTRFTIIYFPVRNILALVFAVFILLVCISSLPIAYHLDGKIDDPVHQYMRWLTTSYYLCISSSNFLIRQKGYFAMEVLSNIFKINYPVKMDNLTKILINNTEAKFVLFFFF